MTAKQPDGAAAEPSFPLDHSQYLQAILDSTNLATYLKDRHGRYVFVNRQYELLAKVARETIYGKYDEDLFPAPVAKLFREQDAEVMARRALVEFEETIPLPDGVFSFITAKFPLLDADGRVYAVGGVCIDITLRKHLSEETLAAERERLAVTLRSIGEGVISTDTDGKVALLNPVAEQLTGWSSAAAVGRSIEEVCSVAVEGPGRDFEHPARAALARGEAVHLQEDAVLVARDGARRYVTASAAPMRDRAGTFIGAVLSLRDVTEQRRLSEELFKSRKLESVGILAGGIAHDFNNILEGILGNISLAASQPATPAAALRYLEAAQRAATRARGLTHQLLTFSRGGDPVKELSSIGELIHDFAGFVLAGSAVSCECDVPDDLWLVDIDRGQLSQVVQNIVINARQAMPTGGVVRIRCANLEPAPPELGGAPPDGRAVSIVISDDGPGIPAGVVDRIFDPYFSTKEGGSGLGLAVAFSVVKKHGGHLAAGAADGGGARFTIVLPAARPGAAPAAREEPAVMRRDGTVLVVDDDEDVLEVTAAMLEQLGYQVALARDGCEAVTTYSAVRRGGAPVELVILDLTIPGGAGGVAALRDILAVDPQAKVMVSSGYSDHPCLANHREYGFVAAVVKPYTIAELSAKLAAVLG